jgi:hypothetical protein
MNFGGPTKWMENTPSILSAYCLAIKPGSLNLMLKQKDAEKMVDSAYNKTVEHISIIARRADCFGHRLAVDQR